jgi:hypothetical protein
MKLGFNLHLNVLQKFNDQIKNYQKFHFYNPYRNVRE